MKTSTKNNQENPLITLYPAKRHLRLNLLPRERKFTREC